MKQSEIVVGQEYAQFFARWNSHSPCRVLVLEKGLKIGRAKGRGVRVRFLDGNNEERICNSIELHHTWADWTESERRAEKIAEQRREQKGKILDAARYLKATLESFGQCSNVKIAGSWIDIRLDKESATDFAMWLEQFVKLPEAIND